MFVTDADTKLKALQHPSSALLAIGALAWVCIAQAPPTAAKTTACRLVVL